jgi:hypothetical protein
MDMRQTAVSNYDFTSIATRASESGAKLSETEGKTGNSRLYQENGIYTASRETGEESVRYDVSQGASRLAGIMRNSPYPGEESAVVDETLEEEQTQEQEKKTTGYTQEDVDYMERLLQRMTEKSSTGTTTSTKKKLTYNYKRVSSAIMRSKTRMQANSALRSANSTLADLRRKAGSGQYSDEELEIAISHANKMIRTARKKVSNLQQEEAQDKSDKDVEHSKERDNTMQRQRHVQKEDFQKVDVELDGELQMLKKRLKQLSKTEKNGHRQNENFDLLMADMEYLKRKIDLMRQDQTSGQTTDQSWSSQSLAAETQTAADADSVKVTDTAVTSTTETTVEQSTPVTGFDASV